MWFLKKSAPTLPCFSIGDYDLDQSVDHLRAKLASFSPHELDLLNREVVFLGEEVFHAPPANHLGVEWDIVLGTVNGVVYKIAAQFTGQRHLVGRLHRELTIYCTRNFRSKGNEAIWNASNGNVILQSTNFGDEAVLNIFCTSSGIRQLQVLRPT